MANRVGVYLHDKHMEWLQNQPRSFNLSDKVREFIDTLIGSEDEVKQDGINTIKIKE